MQNADFINGQIPAHRIALAKKIDRLSGFEQRRERNRN
jgi:hypothetical protein